MADADRMKVLYFCEGYTDIRFVVGLSEICDLTMVAPVWEFQISGLAERIAQSGAQLRVVTIEGKRPAFQLRSFVYLLRNMRAFDVVLSQDMVRGSLNTTVAGKLLGVPVVTITRDRAGGVLPVPARARAASGALEAVAGEAFIRFAMQVSGAWRPPRSGWGRISAMSPGGSRRGRAIGGYYGVDTEAFKPATAAERHALRERHDLPLDRFIIFFSSRISHEKDPETVLQAVARVRSQGLDAVVLNLGGGYPDFLNLARELGFSDADDWIIGRPAVHPMRNLSEYFQLADVVVQSSLAEGAAFSTLEGARGRHAGHRDRYRRDGRAAERLRAIDASARRRGDGGGTALGGDNPADARAQAVEGRALRGSGVAAQQGLPRSETVLERAYGRRPHAARVGRQASAVSEAHPRRRRLRPSRRRLAQHGSRRRHAAR